MGDSLKLAFLTADNANSSFILANDPDADRLAVAEKLPSGKWYQFNGDQVGAILAVFLLDKYITEETKEDNSKKLFIASNVSSQLVRKIVETEGARYEETLTGFKYMAHKAIDLKSEGFTHVLSYEQSIGYMIGDIVPDKDGISAAAVMAQLYAQQREEDKTVMDYLEQIFLKYGFYLQRNGSFTLSDVSKVTAFFDSLRNPYPSEFGKFKIKSVRDQTLGFDSGQEDKKTLLPATPDHQMLTFIFENECSLTLRISGTECQLKYYSESRGTTREEAQKVLDELFEEGLQPHLFQPHN